LAQFFAFWLACENWAKSTKNPFAVMIFVLENLVAENIQFHEFCDTGINFVNFFGFLLNLGQQWRILWQIKQSQGKIFLANATESIDNFFNLVIIDLSFEHFIANANFLFCRILQRVKFVIKNMELSFIHVLIHS
jgi:hypothetical protein